MLAADKLQLQSALKQQATALKEKEFNLHHSNMNTVGTISAVLAGLDITLLIEFSPADNVEWGNDRMIMIARVLKFLYYVTIVAAFCSNMIVVSQTTLLSVLGAGMALRGPDGSMMVATDGIYEERNSVFLAFGYGLACTVGSVVVCVWLVLHWEAALCCMLLLLFTCRTIWLNYQRVKNRFAFDEDETVDFQDIMEGPANIQAVYKYNNNDNNRRTSHQNQRKIASKHYHNANRGAQSSASSMELGLFMNESDSSDDWNKPQQRRVPIQTI